MKYLLTLLSAVLACANCHSASSVILVDNGVARCHIIVEKDAPPSADFGAREIAKYFGKASGAEVKVGEEVKVEGQERSIPIFIGVDATAGTVLGTMSRSCIRIRRWRRGRAFSRSTPGADFTTG